MSLPGGASFLFVCVCQSPFTCSVADNPYCVCVCVCVRVRVWVYVHVCVCVRARACVIHAELQSAALTTVQWVDSVAPQRLQHFGCCVTSPVAVTATTWSCRPSASLCMEHQTDEMGPVRGGRAARWYGDPGPSVSPGCSVDGRPCEWLWLQSRVAWHRGGCASLHGLLHLLAVMNVKLIKAH